MLRPPGVDAATALWGRAVLRGPEGQDVRWEIRGHGAPDLDVVDALARSRVRLSRRGWSLTVCDASPELVEMLELLGLLDVLQSPPSG